MYVESQWHDGGGIRRWKVKGKRWSGCWWACGTFMSVRSSEGVFLSAFLFLAPILEQRRHSGRTFQKLPFDVFEKDRAATTIRTIRITSREYACVYSCMGYVFDNTLEAQSAFLKVHTPFCYHNTTSINLRNSFHLISEKCTPGSMLVQKRLPSLTCTIVQRQSNIQDNNDTFPIPLQTFPPQAHIWYSTLVKIIPCAIDRPYKSVHWI